MEIAWELDSVANEITVPVDVKLKRKSGQKKSSCGREINSQHVILNDITQSPQLGVAIGTKLALPIKNMTQQSVTSWVCNKERAN